MNPAMKDADTLHLMTQDNQPYGSVRRCCEECGIMIWPYPQPAWTSDRNVYANPPAPYRTCRQVITIHSRARRRGDGGQMKPRDKAALYLRIGTAPITVGTLVREIDRSARKARRDERAKMDVYISQGHVDCRCIHCERTKKRAKKGQRS